ncbi:MAG: Rieske (2Fe-2S) protein [Deltaproteobacteria bacterium]|nr:Rieske (2Fe-2S) protein [Deltaproteobacteria bacterium]
MITTGPLGDEPDATPVQPGDPDARPSVDARIGAPDAGSAGPACTGGQVDCGAASAIAIGTPKRISGTNVYIVRDAGGLFAVSSKCTHEGAQNNVTSGHFHCPRHSANFNFDGSIISGPVSRALAHYALCVLANGNVGVDTVTTVAATQRLAL